jgi:hypothetical protein
MTVKFRDPLSAQACVVVRPHPCPGLLSHNLNFDRKCTDDSFPVDKSKRPFSLGNSDSSAVVQVMMLMAMTLTGRRNAWMSLLNGS